MPPVPKRPVPVPAPSPSPKMVCEDCGADISKDRHRPGCPDDSGLECMACCDTGLDSRGGPCYPCALTGRLDKIRQRKALGALFK